MGLWKPDFSTISDSMQSTTAFLPMSSASKDISYARLSRNTERQKAQFIVFKTRTKRIGEAWNCLKYSFFISVHWRVVQYIELWCNK